MSARKRMHSDALRKLMAQSLCLRFGLARSCFLVEEDVWQLTQATCRHSAQQNQTKDIDIPWKTTLAVTAFESSSLADLFCQFWQAVQLFALGLSFWLLVGLYLSQVTRLNGPSVCRFASIFSARFYCMFVGRLWTEWYPLVPIAALSVFILTASYLGGLTIAISAWTPWNPWKVTLLVLLLPLFWKDFVNSTVLKIWGCFASFAALILASSHEGNWSLLLGHWADPRNATLGCDLPNRYCVNMIIWMCLFTFFHFSWPDAFSVQYVIVL